MAKCDLSIHLDDPQAVYPGGGTITGVVRVNADKDVNCKALEVSSGWKTHGRGNVATGVSEKKTVFSGEWRAGEQAEYRFELKVGHWPPSYHGHYLSIDHYIDARAKIPWGFDPKASEPFLMRPTCGPEGAIVASNVKELSGPLGCIIGSVILTAFVGFGIAMLMTIGLFALLFIGPIALIGGSIWFIKYVLPKWALGEVTCELSPDTVSPGDQVSGSLVIHPKKNVTINAVTLTLEARETVVSGSGSNRTTHNNVFLEQKTTLQEATTLKAGNEHRFPMEVLLPDDAPFSVDLDDNDLVWQAKLRVDIPRWPDWTKDFKLTVVPSGESLPEKQATKRAAVTAPVTAPGAESSGDAGITFAETAQHIWAVRDDREQVDTLVDAVSGLTFQLEAFIERRLLYSGDEDPHVYEDGYAVWAHHTEPPLPMVLYVPHELADEFEQVGRDKWSGRGTIVGWDRDHRRLQVKLERPEGLP